MRLPSGEELETGQDVADGLASPGRRWSNGWSSGSTSPLACLPAATAEDRRAEVDLVIGPAATSVSRASVEPTSFCRLLIGGRALGDRGEDRVDAVGDILARSGDELAGDRGAEAADRAAIAVAVEVLLMIAPLSCG